MNKKSFKLAALFMSMLAMVTFSSCSDDDSPVKEEESGEVLKGSVTLENPGYGEDNWIYFSFSKGEVLNGIKEANRANDLTWDIAFYRYNVRTNGGLSGKGKGGAFDTEITDFKAVTSVSNSKFTTDVMGEVTSSMSSFPPPSVKAPLNEVLGAALKFQGPPPTYTPNNHVYIVRTADGKYAKIQITGFYNDEGKSGHVQFTYAYQPDGSMNF